MMSRKGSLYGELRQPRVIMVLICCIAIWLKFGMILWNRVPNAPFPYNCGHRNAVTYYFSTLWDDARGSNLATLPLTSTPITRAPSNVANAPVNLNCLGEHGGNDGFPEQTVKNNAEAVCPRIRWSNEGQGP